LRHRVRRDGDDLVVEALVAFAVGVVVHAVQQVVVEHAALAVDVVRASRTRLLMELVVAAVGAWREPVTSASRSEKLRLTSGRASVW